jgi:magnesium-transporting ATPase (P-type)
MMVMLWFDVPIGKAPIATDIQSAIWVSRMLWGWLALVSILGLILLLRRGVPGWTGIVASLIQAAGTLAAILLMGITISQDVILAVLTISVLAIIANVMVCEALLSHRPIVRVDRPGSRWRFLLTVGLVTLIFGGLFLSAVIAYLLGGLIRNVAAAIWLGSLAALLTTSIVLVILLAIVAMGRRGVGRKGWHLFRRRPSADDDRTPDVAKRCP